METVNIHKAKTHLSRYVDKVVLGEEIIICKSGKPLAKLVKYNLDNKRRAPGAWSGQVKISDDFDLLPEDFTKYFNQNY